MRRALVLAGAAALVLAGTAASAAPAGLVPRDAAAEEARQELSKAIYHTDDPSLLQRIWNRISAWLDSFFQKVGEHAPGGVLGALVLLAAAVVLVWFALWQVGPLRRGARRSPLLSTVDGTSTARQHRERAAQLSIAGRYAEAIREWLRASARDLEERGVLAPRPGRTADEVAAEASAAVPELADPLGTAARIFDEVWYGGRPATPDLAAALERADTAVRQSALVVTR